MLVNISLFYISFLKINTVTWIWFATVGRKIEWMCMPPSTPIVAHSTNGPFCNQDNIYTMYMLIWLRVLNAGKLTTVNG